MPHRYLHLYSKILGRLIIWLVYAFFLLSKLNNFYFAFGPDPIIVFYREANKDLISDYPSLPVCREYKPILSYCAKLGI